MRNIIILFLLFNINLNARETNLNSIIKTLKTLESLDNVKAIGDNGKAYGILQIHKIYVEEVNNRFGTDYSHRDMFEESCAEEVFYLYMEYASERFCEKYGREPNEEEIVRMHNGGLYRGYRIKATEDYYKRYLKFKNI